MPKFSQVIVMEDHFTNEFVFVLSKWQTRYHYNIAVTFVLLFLLFWTGIEFQKMQELNYSKTFFSNFISISIEKSLVQ